MPVVTRRGGTGQVDIDCEGACAGIQVADFLRAVGRGHVAGRPGDGDDLAVLELGDIGGPDRDDCRIGIRQAGDGDRRLRRARRPQ